jgi:hypothetical protein
MPKKLLFENVPCSRCGGSGNYSYCQMHGTTCFKCGGAGATLTKRGKLAQNWLTEKRKVPVSALKIGDEFWFDSIFGAGWVKVTEAWTAESNMVTAIDSKGETVRYGNGSEKVRKRMTNEAAKALKAAALEFQGTLTKAGTVRKKVTRTP